MKKTLLPILFLLLGANAFAQQDFFALTGKDTQNIAFNDFRTLDLNNGTSGATLFSAESTPNVFSQVQKMKISEDKTSFHHSQATQIATLAFDEFNNKLVYTPMFSSNIYVLDNKTKEITLVESNVIKSTPCDIGSQMTRMTTGYDGNIYAISNSGSQFIQISNKNGRYSVADLGTIKNDASNGNNLLNVMNIGFGGDMIADADNNFYVFSASGNVFKVSTNDLTAKFLGKISGLPENYSLNGAAVNAEGNVVIASAKALSFYEINLKNLSAKPMENNLGSLHVYDLASKYFANDNKASNAIASNNLDIYPTNVKDNRINLKVQDKNLKGNVSVEIYNYSGNKILIKEIKSIEKNTNSKIELNNLISGAYIVVVKDEAGKSILTKKILVTE